MAVCGVHGMFSFVFVLMQSLCVTGEGGVDTFVS